MKKEIFRKKLLDIITKFLFNTPNSQKLEQLKFTIEADKHGFCYVLKNIGNFKNLFVDYNRNNVHIVLKHDNDKDTNNVKELFFYGFYGSNITLKCNDSINYGEIKITHEFSGKNKTINICQI